MDFFHIFILLMKRLILYSFFWKKILKKITKDISFQTRENQSKSVSYLDIVALRKSYFDKKENFENN
jgi:hypothetical protein